MTTKHTPGPWVVYVENSGGDEFYQIITAALHGPEKLGKFIGGCNSHLRDGVGNKVVGANARLIAAAPDLLEIVRDVREAWGAEFDRDEPISGADVVEWLGGLQLRLKVVLAKAEGRE